MFHPQGPTFFELAQQALSSTERGYDLLGPKFDHTPFRTGNPFFAAFKQRLVEHCGPSQFNTILDVCCGTGAAMQALAPLCQDQLVGIDMSQGMLKQAAENLTGTTCPFELVRGNVFNMPFGATFDLAVSFGAFGHILPTEEQRFIAVLKGEQQASSLLEKAWLKYIRLARNRKQFYTLHSSASNQSDYDEDYSEDEFDVA